MAALRRKKLSWTIRADELANALDSRPQFPLLRGGGDKASNGQAELLVYLPTLLQRSEGRRQEEFPASVL